MLGVEALFTEKDFYLYDKYKDGDPYEDEHYIQIFKTVLQAVHQNKKLKVEYTKKSEQTRRFIFLPWKIEYSQKDDKFRCLSVIKNRHAVLNIARIKNCTIADDADEDETSEIELPYNNRTSVSLEIYDNRKAMERMMLAFAHFEKTAFQINKNTYRLTINYDAFDETELVIRVLSFGPMVKVLEPQSFVDLVRARIEKQLELFAPNFP